MEFSKSNFKENFASACMMLGVVSLGIHYGEIVKNDIDIAMPLVIGPPECGKSKCVQLFSEAIGIKEKVQGKYTK